MLLNLPRETAKIRASNSMAQSSRRWSVASDLPEKVIEQMTKTGLPFAGRFPFKPRLTTNRKGELIIDKQAPTIGPKRGKKGFVDEQGRIWIKDHPHAGMPTHWDVQIDDGADYIRVDQNGEEVQKS
jgi:hypothetical protein